MAAHADEEALVLCGHSHGGGVVDIAPNVRVIAGIAEYGTPKINGRFCF
jgi:predicted MPP superfamily phosphohydrolase